jgi:hypothetical protein
MTYVIRWKDCQAREKRAIDPVFGIRYSARFGFDRSVSG